MKFLFRERIQFFEERKKDGGRCTPWEPIFAIFVPVLDNIVHARFTVFRTFLYVFMRVVKVHEVRVMVKFTRR